MISRIKIILFNFDIYLIVLTMEHEKNIVQAVRFNFAHVLFQSKKQH